MSARASETPAARLALFRVAALDARARPHEAGGAAWFPRPFQGAGRHDNPALYGCLYASLEPLSAVVESLAMFRGAGRLHASLLVRAGRPLALVELALPADLALVDLDDPRLLHRARLRPSGVATRDRGATHALAARFFVDGAAGLRWWSTLEGSWINATLFDRAAPALSVGSVRELSLEDPLVHAAAEFLGLRPPA